MCLEHAQPGTGGPHLWHSLFIMQINSTKSAPSATHRKHLWPRIARASSARAALNSRHSSHRIPFLCCSATFGSGLFIICVVFSAVVLTDANAAGQGVPDHRAYLRDASAYLIASASVLCLLWFGRLHAAHGVLLLLGYVAYLAVCLCTRSRHSSGSAARRALLRATSAGGSEQYQIVSQSVMEQGGGEQDATKLQQQQQQQAAAEVEMVPLALAVHEPESPTVGPGSAPASGRPTSPGARSLSFDKRRPHSAAALAQGGGAASPGVTFPAGAAAQGLHAVAGSAAGAGPSLLPMQGSQSKLTLHGAEWHRQDCAGSGLTLRADWAALLDEYLHLHGKSEVRRALAYGTAPLVLAMHATMPALHPGVHTLV